MVESTKPRPPSVTMGLIDTLAQSGPATSAVTSPSCLAAVMVL